jgi:hypothetical protein
VEGEVVDLKDNLFVVFTNQRKKVR